MATWDNTVVTQLGMNLQAKLDAGAQLRLTKAMTSTSYVNPTTLERQTTISNAKQTLILNDVIPLDGGHSIFPITLSNLGLTTAYTLNQIWVFANDPDLGEIPYFIAQAEEPDTVPTETELRDFTITYRFDLIRANATGGFKPSIDPLALATKSDILALQGKVTELKDETTIEVGTITLSNTKVYPHSNASVTVSLQQPRRSLDYIVHAVVVSSSGNVETVETYDYQLNGFKLRYTGSAASATIKYYVWGGMTA